MFWQLKNRIKEETGNDVDLIPSIINSNQPKVNKEKHSRHSSTTSLGSFTIDGNKEEVLGESSLEIKLADGKVITPKDFKKLESKEEEWRRKLQKKEEVLTLKLKKAEEEWKKQLEDKEKKLMEELEKKENEIKALEDEKNALKLKNLNLEINAKKALDYQKKVCQYQEDIDQLEGFQTQEMAKIKHLLLVKEQEIAEKDTLLKENETQLKSIRSEVSRLRNIEQQFENTQDDLEELRHNCNLERTQLLSNLAEKEEDVRHLKDRVLLLEERNSLGLTGEMTVDERVQKLLGERALFERRLEEAHLHLSQIKSSWSTKIEALETQVGRLCRQASEESSEKRQVELERNILKGKLVELEQKLKDTITKSEYKDVKIEKYKLEKMALEDEIKKVITKREEDVQSLHKEINSMQKNMAELEEKLDSKNKLNEEKENLIQSMTQKLCEKEEMKNTTKKELDNLKEALDSERKMYLELSCALEKEREEKDEMMMRNAQIAQEVELVKQDFRNCEIETTELRTKLLRLEEQLKDKQKELNKTVSEKSELDSVVKKIEKIEKEKEVASVVERELKAKVAYLENELFEKNKTVKILQQRLGDMKKTLQKELKIPSSAMDSDNYLACTPGSLNGTSIVSAPTVPTSSVTFRSEETYDNANDDVNFKYLKHVLMKFLTSRECEAQHLTRAVATLLRFSAEEEKLLKETLEWKMSWFGTRPNLGNGQTAKTIPPS